MAEPTVIPIVFDDQGTTAVLDTYLEGLKEVQKEEKSLNDIQAAIREGFKEVATAISDTNKKIDDSAKATAEAAKRQKTFSSTLLDTVKNYKVFGVSVGDAVDKVKALRTRQNDLTGSLKKTTSGFKSLRVAILATGIGALIIGITTLIGLFVKSRAGSEKFQVVLASIGQVVNVVVDRLAQLGGAIVALFSGDFQGAADQAKDAFAGVGEELRTEIRLAGELKRQIIELDKQAALLRITSAARLADLKEANKIAEDTTQTEAVRLENAIKARDISKEILAEELAIGEARLLNQLGFTENTAAANAFLTTVQKGGVAANDILDNLGLDDSNQADLHAFADSIVDIQNKRAQFLEIETTANNKVNIIRQETLRKEQAILAARQKAFEQLQKEIEAVDEIAGIDPFEGLDPSERLEAERDAAIESANIRFDRIEQLAKDAKTEIDISRQRAAILEAIESEYLSGLARIRQRELDTQPLELIGSDDDIALLKTDREKLSTELSKELDVLVEDANKKIEEAEREVRSLSTVIINAFGIDEDSQEAAFIIDTFNSLGDSILNSFASRTERLVSEQEAIIDRSKNNLDQLKSDLDDELEEREAGRANNVDSIKQAIAQEEAALVAAEERKAAILDKAAKDQLKREAALQVAGIVTTGIELVKGGAKLGPVGFITAVGLLATLIPLIAGLKKQAAGVTKLRKGGKLKGPSHERDGIDIYMPGESRPRYNAEGDEWVINKEDSNEHDDFLKRTNAGEFRGLNLNRIVDTYKNSPFGHGRTIPSPAPQSPRYTSEDLYKAVQSAMKQQTKEIIAYLSKRPVTVSKEDDLMYIQNQNTKRSK